MKYGYISVCLNSWIWLSGQLVPGNGIHLESCKFMKCGYFSMWNRKIESIRQDPRTDVVGGGFL